MPVSESLVPSIKLASLNKTHFPNENAAYREARNALLNEEIELRRHIERVAAQRRALPAGGRIPKDFELVGEARADPVLQSLRQQGDIACLQHDVRRAT